MTNYYEIMESKHLDSSIKKSLQDIYRMSSRKNTTAKKANMKIKTIESMTIVEINVLWVNMKPIPLTYY